MKMYDIKINCLLTKILAVKKYQIYIYCHPQTDRFVLSDSSVWLDRRTLEAGIETRLTLR